MKPNHRIKMVMVLVFSGLLLGLGCNSSERTTAPHDTRYEGATSETPGAPVWGVLTNSPTTVAILESVMGSINVAGARAMLEAEGYTYTDTNSLVLMQRRAARGWTEATPSGWAIDPSRVPRQRLLTGIDSVYWLAFENPTHDSANHTAVLTANVNGRNVTVLVELDVSSDTPTVIRQGKVDAGVFTPGDIGTDGWLGCVAKGGAGVAVGCALSNCGWGHCAAVGGAGVLAACTVGWLWSAVGL